MIHLVQLQRKNEVPTCSLTHISLRLLPSNITVGGWGVLECVQCFTGNYEIIVNEMTTLVTVEFEPPRPLESQLRPDG